MPCPQKPIALPRSCGGNASSSTACESGWSAPPVAPCRILKTINEPRVGASPQRKDDAVKPTTDAISSRFRPKTLASHPVIGRVIAFADQDDLSPHVRSAIV